MKFSDKNFLSKFDQIHRKLRNPKNNVEMVLFWVGPFFAALQQMRNHHPHNHLKWRCLQKQLTMFSDFNYCCKALILRCLLVSWLHHCIASFYSTYSLLKFRMVNVVRNQRAMVALQLISCRTNFRWNLIPVRKT